MTVVAIDPKELKDAVAVALPGMVQSLDVDRGEVTLVVASSDYLRTMQILRDDPGCRFEQLIDLCGIDMSAYRDGAWEGARYGVVVHLLSIGLNQRLRVKAYCPDDEFPLLPSVTGVWRAANWFEREAFDLFGIVFDGHEDLRRILTDYGFIGHPFRKDFPLSGHVEMRYDADQRRVIYEPLTIEPREITPRILREKQYAEGQ